MKRRTRAETEEELRWFIQDATAELGLRGLPIEPQAGGPGSKNDNPGPGAEQLKAVRRERVIRAAFGELPEDHRRMLAQCYELRRVPPHVESAWGTAARGLWPQTVFGLVLLAFAQRLPRGEGFVLTVEPLEADLAALDGATLLNAAIESVVRRCPEQYLWSYNRYKAPRRAPPRPEETA
jgi:hypothetical protein